MQFEDYALKKKWNAGDFASRSKATAKPQKRDSAISSTRTTPTGERIWTDVELGEYSLSDNSLSKKLIHLLRHGNLPRAEEGAIEFWSTRLFSERTYAISTVVWCKVEEHNGKRLKSCQYCTDSSGAILYLRALRGHSGRDLVGPSLQDNVVIPSNFFQFIYHVGCAINLLSIINSGLIPGGQNSNNRQ